MKLGLLGKYYEIIFISRINMLLRVNSRNLNKFDWEIWKLFAPPNESSISLNLTSNYLSRFLSFFLSFFLFILLCDTTQNIGDRWKNGFLREEKV